MNTTVHRRKKHKSGKILSISVLAASMGFLILLVSTQIISGVVHQNSKPLPTYTVDINDVVAGKALPDSPEINSAKGSEIFSEPLPAKSTRYDAVWDRLLSLTKDGNEAERVKNALNFLSSRNFITTGPYGVIVSKSTGEKVRPSTLMCYINGYIPSRPYLKVNCPNY